MHQIKKYKAVLFDLDGTLLDTAEGVLSSIRYTINRMGYPPLPEEILRTFIGPPVKRALMAAYHLEEAEADQATEIFRTRYKEHDLLKARPYDGILELVKDLRNSGYLIGVATLKREDYALTILEHFGISPLCDVICGSDFASKMTKADVLEKVLGKLGVPCGQALLLGDTASDGQGCACTGVDLLAVTYGFGFHTQEERDRYHPVFTAGSAAEIRSFFEQR